MKRFPLGALLCCVLLIGSTSLAMAAGQWYVTINGAKTGKFASEATGNLRDGKIMVIAVSHEIVSPRDHASGLPTGKRQHGAITIVKEWGPASPQLFAALCTNEVLSTVLLEYIETDATGKERVTSTIKLTNAHIVTANERWSFGATQTGSSGGSNAHSLSMTYQKIEWTYGSIMAEDSWEASK